MRPSRGRGFAALERLIGRKAAPGTYPANSSRYLAKPSPASPAGSTVSPAGTAWAAAGALAKVTTTVFGSGRKD